MMSGGEFFACSTWLQYIAPAVVPRGAAGALSIAAAAAAGGGGAGIIADNFADEIILEPRQIAVHYVKTWFLLDLVSSIPLDYIILLYTTYIILLFSPDANVTQLIHAGAICSHLRQPPHSRSAPSRTVVNVSEAIVAVPFEEKRILKNYFGGKSKGKRERLQFCPSGHAITGNQRPVN